MLLLTPLGQTQPRTAREVTFFTDPPGARVFLDVSGNRGGDYLGLSGQAVAIDPDRFARTGSLDVRFELAGYRTEVRNIKSLYFNTQSRYPEQGVVRLEPLGPWVRLHSWRRELAVLGVVGVGLALTGLRLRGARKRAEGSLRDSLRKIAEQEQRLRQMGRDLLEAREDGRLQMAHDLHDGLLQFLVATELHLENVRDEVGENHELARALHGLRAATVEGRRLIRQLGPAPLERGLLAGIEDLVRGLQQDGFEVSCQLQFPVSLPDAVSLAVFRVIQEALNNVRKHAGKPGPVTLEVAGQLAGIRLVVADQGQGFDANTVRLGVGLTSMKSRAEGMGGRLTITSNPGEGTRVEAWFPTYSPDPGEC